MAQESVLGVEQGSERAIDGPNTEETVESKEGRWATVVGRKTRAESRVAAGYKTQADSWLLGREERPLANGVGGREQEQRPGRSSCSQGRSLRRAETKVRRGSVGHDGPRDGRRAALSTHQSASGARFLPPGARRASSLLPPPCFCSSPCPLRRRLITPCAVCRGDCEARRWRGRSEPTSPSSIAPGSGRFKCESPEIQRDWCCSRASCLVRALLCISAGMRARSHSAAALHACDAKPIVCRVLLRLRALLGGARHSGMARRGVSSVGAPAGQQQRYCLTPNGMN